jgi:hypothetical protein
MFCRIFVTVLGDESKKQRNFAICLYAKRRMDQAQQALFSQIKETAVFVS